jgi:glycyl-tRNA synthetase
MTEVTLDTIANLAKQRGFVFQASEIYGGLRSSYDYGPLGVELLKNVKEEWWRSMVQQRSDIVGIDSAILQARKVWQASGHEEVFTDPLVECSNCNGRFRQDKLADPDKCPSCGKTGTFTDPRNFNLMFRTHMGPIDSEDNLVYLRPETAQGIFTNFENVRRTNRLKLPFGIAQVGKSFRNEITPGQFVFRTREFEQMEMEYFVPPEDGPRWYEYWCQERLRWFVELGIPEEQLRLRPHDPDELSHYSVGTSDIEFLYPWGWGELEGVANRTDFDLSQHAQFSGQDLTYYDQDADRRYVPHVIEPAVGADRALLAFLLAAYSEEEVRGEKRTLLRLDHRLAPIKVAVLPLSRNEKLNPVAEEVAASLRPHFMIDVDTSGSIGRRYRRQDEVGTPLCVTVDFDTLDDKAVTVRERDSMDQDRVPVDELLATLQERLPT